MSVGVTTDQKQTKTKSLTSFGVIN